MFRFLLLLGALSLASFPLWAASASDFTLLGMKLAGSDKEEIRKSLYDWDGFQQSPSSLYRKQWDRFFPKNLMRETYYLDFRYEKDGKFSSLRILYRPHHAEYSRPASSIDTQALLQQLVPLIGSPQQRVRHTSPGIAGYNGYRWEDEQSVIELAREDEHPARPVVLTMRMKNTELASNYQP